MAEQECKWRGLPQRFGNWHTIYTRMNRWAKSGVLAAQLFSSCLRWKTQNLSVGSASSEIGLMSKEITDR